ncbi:filamentous hemagglutinin family N-terminal domain-containing protein, partial [Desulfuromusa kysingii]
MGKTGKVQYRGIFFQFNTSKRRKLVTLLTLCHFFFANFAWAAEIVIDGQTATSLATVDHVTDVTTATIRNNTAFNSFSTFNVSSGDVVNLYLPGTTTNLMNLVHSEQSTINGLLNSIKDGQIGGHVFFANPHGVIIGNQGIINVGALSISTPTQSFMDSFFLGAGDPQQESVDMLLDGSVPLNGNGLISVAGELNSIGDITLLGGSVNNSGVIASGASFSGSAPTFSDVVNVNDLQSAAKIEVVGGDIYIRAENAVTVDGGTIAANGVGESNKAGDIDIHAQAVTLSSGAELYSYNDDAQLQAGDVTLAAVDQADHEQIAVIDSTNAAVAITDTTIRAGSIAISADSSMTASAAGTPVDLAVDAAIVDVSSVASVELNDSHLTTETGALTVAATSTVAADTQADASSTSLPVSGDAAVATTIVDSSAVSHIGGDTILNLAQELDLSSNNKVTVNTTADGSTGGDLAAGGSAAVTVVKRSEAKAYIDGNAELINQPDINVTAESLNNIKTVAKSTSKGASENSEGTQDNLDKYGPETTETDDQGSSKVTLAGALAVTDMANANTQAYVDLTTDDDSNVQTGMGALTVSAKSLSNSSANADGSATQGDVGVGVAVAVNIGNENNRAYIGENTDIAATSVDVAATMADYTTSEGDADTASSYLATATSGSGSKNVGVAGALGLNVSVNTTEAAIKTGAQVDAGSGHVNLESNNNTEATVESKASVKNSGGDEPAAVGVGASVGL